jgi:hypothetical protein
MREVDNLYGSRPLLRQLQRVRLQPFQRPPSIQYTDGGTPSQYTDDGTSSLYTDDGTSSQHTDGELEVADQLREGERIASISQQADVVGRGLNPMADYSNFLASNVDGALDAAIRDTGLVPEEIMG